MPEVLTREYVPQEHQNEEFIKGWLDKPWTKEIGAEVFKKLVNAEQLIGKRPAIPGKDAKPEDLDKFFAGFRAEKPEEYELPKEEGVTPDPLFMKAVQAAFHEGNVSPRQAAKFMERFSKDMKAYVGEQQKAQAAAKVKADKEFEDIAKAGLGEQNKAVMDRVRKAMAENAPAAYKPLLGKLSNENLVIMAGVINSILEKYVPSDELDPHTNGAGGETLEAEREEVKKLQVSPEYTNPFHPKHKEVKAKIDGFYQKLGKELAKK